MRQAIRDELTLAATRLNQAIQHGDLAAIAVLEAGIDRLLDLANTEKKVSK